jgi:HlyD family secretion protein
VTAGDKIVSVISQDNLEIEANVSEVNIGKLIVGNKVQMTFDAFGDKQYTGTVTYIDPGETIVDNVVNYKTKVKIDGDVTGIKSGLTANLKIETAKKDDVLKLPRYTIVEKNGKSYVDKVVSKDKTEQVEVTLGLGGNDGSVEIVSGLNEGDSVRANAQP